MEVRDTWLRGEVGEAGEAAGSFIPIDEEDVVAVMDGGDGQVQSCCSLAVTGGGRCDEHAGAASLSEGELERRGGEFVRLGRR